MKTLAIIALMVGTVCLIGRFALEGGAVVTSSVDRTEVELTRIFK